MSFQHPRRGFFRVFNFSTRVFKFSRNCVFCIFAALSASLFVFCASLALTLIRHHLSSLTRRIYINEYADYHSVVLETNKVVTVFGKEGLRGYLQKKIQKGNLVRIKRQSLQVGDGTAPIAAAFGLKASDNSISDSEQKSNTLDENSAKKSENSAIKRSMESTAAVESGESKADYNLIVTVANGQPRYFIIRCLMGKLYTTKIMKIPQTLYFG